MNANQLSCALSLLSYESIGSFFNFGLFEFFYLFLKTLSLEVSAKLCLLARSFMDNRAINRDTNRRILLPSLNVFKIFELNNLSAEWCRSDAASRLVKVFIRRPLVNK